MSQGLFWRLARQSYLMSGGTGSGGGRQNLRASDTFFRKRQGQRLLFKAYPHTVLSLRPTFGIFQSLSRKEVSSSTEGLEGYPYFLQHPAKGCLHSPCISSNSWISNTEERQQEGKQRLARESSAGCWNRAFQLMLGGPGPFSGLVSEDALLA